MKRLLPAQFVMLLFVGILALGSAAPARSQTLTPSQYPTAPQAASRAPTPPSRPSLLHPFTQVLGDVRRLPTRDNLDWLVVGLATSMVAQFADIEIARDWTRSPTRTFKAGAIVGGTPLELGSAFATFAIGRATNSSKAMNLGSDLIRAQLLAEIMTTGIKQTVRRRRPEGSGFSYPSGHTAVSFASATVLQRHFGWKAGIPAYAAAGYVAASRVQTKKHYLSDVALGAAVGVIAAHTVTLGHGVIVEPMIVVGGGGVMFTRTGK